MIWLPGAYHVAQDFLSAGFHEAVRKRRAPLDLLLVDLDMQHLSDRSALERLRCEAILPARAAGVSVWLAGISMGGLLALDCAAKHGAELAGLCLFAPYLGNRLLTAQIAAAPGLAAWQPQELGDADEAREIWRYLKQRTPQPPLRSCAIPPPASQPAASGRRCTWGAGATIALRKPTRC